jgi:hypothetical protein
MIIFSQIVFALSIIGILVILLRKVPMILRYPRQPFEEVSLAGIFDKLKNRITSNEFVHAMALPITEKILRKIKIFVLKFDNFLAKLVSHLRHRRKNIEEEMEIKNGNDNNDAGLPS